MVEVELTCVLLPAVGSRHRFQLPCPWVVPGISPVIRCVEERVVSYHIRAHLVRPLQHLGANIIQEGV